MDITDIIPAIRIGIGTAALIAIVVFYFGVKMRRDDKIIFGGMPHLLAVLLWYSLTFIASSASSQQTQGTSVSAGGIPLLLNILIIAHSLWVAGAVGLALVRTNHAQAKN